MALRKKCQDILLDDTVQELTAARKRNQEAAAPDSMFRINFAISREVFDPDIRMALLMYAAPEEIKYTSVVFGPDSVPGKMPALAREKDSYVWFELLRQLLGFASNHHPSARKGIERYHRTLQSTYTQLAKNQTVQQKETLLRAIAEYDCEMRSCHGGSLKWMHWDASVWQNILAQVTAADRHAERAAGGSTTTGSCNRWNSALGCGNTSCKYRHVCSMCSATGHGATTCSKAGATSGGAPPRPGV